MGMGCPARELAYDQILNGSTHCVLGGSIYLSTELSKVV